ncbi:hypothetical protein GCM10025789_07360 [Tessaracoccus lubricantis]|uniref:F5/8 type C domain-containing protein n=1 Tax=Tessaracoccus lubricantis TaxID=545543 RepID=A0ABP9F3L6_9ACTN
MNSYPTLARVTSVLASLALLASGGYAAPTAQAAPEPIPATLAPLPTYAETSGVAFIGPIPGVANVTAAGDVVTLENGALKVVFDVTGVPDVTTFLNKATGANQAIDQGRLLHSANATTDLGALTWTRTGAPVVSDLAPDAASSRIAQTLPGKQVTVTYTATHANGFAANVTWTAELRQDANYVRQHLKADITAGSVGPSGTAPLNIGLLEVTLPNARTTSPVDGSPVASGINTRETFFTSVEHPMAKTSIGADDVVRQVVPSRRTYSATANSTIEGTVVYGVSNPGQLRRSAQYYVERERAHERRTYLHYQSWYDLKPNAGTVQYPLMVNGENLKKSMELFGRELTTRGAKLDSFWVDDGWDYLRDPAVADETNLKVWSFDPTQYPTGFAPQKAIADSYDASMSVWMSPFGGYDPSASRRRDLNASKPAGEQMERNAAGFSLAGARYGQHFRDVVFDMMDNNGVQGFKFDGIGGGLYQTGVNLNYLADYEAMFELLDDMRAHDQEVFVNATVGTWGSPYWLWYVDSIWRDGGDAILQGSNDWSNTPGSSTDKYMTYRDKEQYRNFTKRNRLFPETSLMNHGLIFSPRPNTQHFDFDTDLSKPEVLADAKRAIKTYFAMGLGLQELYVRSTEVDPTTGSDAKKAGAVEWWDTLADYAKWARENEQLFTSARMIGADPMAGVYGSASWWPKNNGEGVLMLRNPTASAKTFTVNPATAFELPAGQATRYTFTERDGDAAPFTADVFRPYTFELQPFQTLLFEAKASNAAITASTATPPPSDGRLDATIWVATANSQEVNGENGRASNVLDNNRATMWHTQYNPSKTAAPHWLTIDMGEATTFNRVDYVPRTQTNGNGTLGAYQWQTSNDGVNFTTINSGTWDMTNTTKTVNFTEPVTARYLRLYAPTGGYAGFTTAADINVFAPPPGDGAPTAAPTNLPDITATTFNHLLNGNSLTVPAGGHLTVPDAPGGWSFVTITDDAGARTNVGWMKPADGQIAARVLVPLSVTPDAYTVELRSTTGSIIGWAPLTVTEENVPPLVTEIPTTFVERNAAVNIAVHAEDGDALTYSAAGLPVGVTIDPATGLISGSSPAEGVYPVTVTVDDGREGVTTTEFTLNVVVTTKLTPSGWTAQASSQETSGEGPVNGRAATVLDEDPATFWHTAYNPSPASPPHWIQVTSPEVVEMQRFDYTPRQIAGATQVGNGTVTKYEWQVSTDGSTFTTVASGAWPATFATKSVTLDQPVAGKIARLAIIESFTRPDSTGSYGNASGLAVHALSTDVTGPAIAPVGDTFIEFGSAVDITISAEDRNAPITFTATGLPAGATMETSGAIIGTPTEQGLFEVSVTASDPAGNQSTATFTLSVGVAPKLAVENPPASMHWSTDAEITFTTTDILEFSVLSVDVPEGWQVSPSQQWLSPGEGSATVTLRAPQAGTSGTISATVTALDGKSSTVGFTVALTDPSVRTIAGAVAWDSAEPQEGGLASPNGYVTAAVDGNAATFWHTQWSGTNPMHPHHVVIDLGSEQEVASFTYLPRNTSECGGSVAPPICNGQIAGYEIYTGTGSFGTRTEAELRQTSFAEPTDAAYTKVAEGTWAVTDGTAKTVVFDQPVITRYLKLRSLSAVKSPNGTSQPWAHAAELTVAGLKAQTPEVLEDVALGAKLVVTPTTIDPGGSLAISGAGFAAGSSVTVTLGTATQVVTAAADGTIAAVLTVSADQAAGAANLSATDGTTTATVRIQVTGTLEPPTVAVDDVTVELGSAVSVQATATGAEIAYAVSGHPALSISSTGLITGLPNAVGATIVTVTVTDADDQAASDTFTLTVQDTTDPVVAAIADLTVVAGSAVSVQVAATDAQSLTYSLSGNDNLSISAAGLITGTATTVGTSTVTVTVTDASDNVATRQFTLTVKPAAEAPILAAIGDQAVELGASITPVTPAATGTAPITYAVTGLPEGVTYSAATNRISGTPTTVTASPATVTVTATNAVGTDTETFTIAVSDTTKPVLATITDRSVEEGTTLSIQVSATDRQGLTYAVSGNDELSISATGLITGTVTTVGTSSVSVTVTDASGNATIRTFTLTVTSKPSPSPSPSPSVSPSPSTSPSASPSPSTSPKPTRSPSVRPSAKPTTTPAKPKYERTAPYTLPGTHDVNGRQWFTQCEDYSQTVRCRTEIWATVVVIEDGRFMRKSGWSFNNLTYLPYMTRQAWTGNPLGDLGATTDGVFSSAGRQWRTECDTAATGRGACRSYTWTTVYSATAKADGGYTFSQANRWVFNNMVLFGDPSLR